MSNHLEGIRVVELGTHVAVPKAARIMADWGAEVIKVEPPKGEPWRYVGPGYEMPAGPDNNPIFEVENINKKSVALNLKTPEGQAAMKTLIRSADVFITNTRTKALEKLGLYMRASGVTTYSDSTISTSQSIAAGTMVEPGTVVEVHFMDTAVQDYAANGNIDSIH